MKVGQLIRRLKAYDKSAEVLIDDEEFGEIELIETDDGPAIIIWPETSLLDPTDQDADCGIE